MTLIETLVAKEIELRKQWLEELKENTRLHEAEIESNATYRQQFLDELAELESL